MDRSEQEAFCMVYDFFTPESQKRSEILVSYPNPIRFWGSSDVHRGLRRKRQPVSSPTFHTHYEYTDKTGFMPKL